MESNKTVTVLAPNGRRQTVKVTQNTTILQIIEEVCKKQGFEAPDYDIKHHRKVLDTSQTIRFSGLPNNAQLELVKATKIRSESPVIIKIQMEDGTHFTGEFLPENSIMDILKRLCPDHSNPETNPVIIYTRREIYGLQALKNTTLKHLGLTGGRAIFRLVHKSPEELKTQANVSAPLPHVPKNEDEGPFLRKRNTSDLSPPKAKMQPQPLPNPQVDLKLKPIDVVNVVKHEKEKIRSKSPSPPLQDKFIGEKIEDKVLKANLKDSETSKDQPSALKQREKSPEKMEVDETNSGPSKDNTVEDDFVFLGNRNAIAFSQEMAQTVRSEDLPDDFFELTITDAKKLIRDIKRTRMELESKQLETKALRSLRESQKQLAALHKYKKAIIRVVFPDHTVLQGTFTPIETVSHIIEFVKEYLEDKSTPFYLYTAPPKEILKEDLRLIETGCVPTAIVYFGTETPRSDGKYLRKDVLDKLVSPSKASNATIKIRKESVRAIPMEQLSENASSEDLQSIGGPSSSSGANNYEDYPSRSPKPAQKTPKWFKLAK